MWYYTEIIRPVFDGGSDNGMTLPSLWTFHYNGEKLMRQ
jgi:hypothetical protein